MVYAGSLGHGDDGTALLVRYGGIESKRRSGVWSFKSVPIDRDGSTFGRSVRQIRRLLADLSIASGGRGSLAHPFCFDLVRNVDVTKSTSSPRRQELVGGIGSVRVDHDLCRKKVSPHASTVLNNQAS